MDSTDQLAHCTGFDWDEGNLLKNWERHGVSASECEQVFFNQPLVLTPAERHSQRESRFFGLGHPDAGRRLYVVFAIRRELIRVISARDMNRKERKAYDTQ